MFETYTLLWWENDPKDAARLHISLQNLENITKQEPVHMVADVEDAAAFLRAVGSKPVFTHSLERLLPQLIDWCEAAGYEAPDAQFIDVCRIAGYIWPTETLDTTERLFAFVRKEDDTNGKNRLDCLDQVVQAMKDTLASWPMLLLQQVEELSNLVNPGLNWMVGQVVSDRQHSLHAYDIPEGRQVVHQLLFREVEIPEHQSFESIFQPEQVADSFASDGPLATLYPSYQPRQGQIDMVEHVSHALADHRHAIVEAGTGTGKSLGYLVPAAQFSLATGEKVVIATHTLHLQTQLLERDVPLVKKLVDKPIHVSILKGRTNYVCMRKIANQLNASGIVGDKYEQSFLMKALVWLKDTPAGEREELPLHGGDSERWSTIQSETETCINKRCPWFKHCYYHRARAVAQQADLIITNHSLVLTDLKADHSVLPGYSYLILDEAHHLEDGATKHLGNEVHYFQVFGILNRLAKDTRSGMLPTLRQKIVSLQYDQSELVGTISNRLDLLLDTLMEIRQTLEEWFHLLAEFIRIQTKLTDDAKLIYRVLDADRSSALWKPIETTFENFHSEIKDVRKHVKKIEQEQEDLKDESLVGQIQDVIGVVKELDRIWEQLLAFMQAEESMYVSWMEREDWSAKPLVSLYMAPIDVGPLLDKHLFSKKQSVILTSATLTVRQSFDHVVRRLGLGRYAETGDLNTLVVESPFQYRNQALLCIPTDMPAMAGEGSKELLEELSDTLIKLARVSKGRMLVLFTSYRMLTNLYDLTSQALEEHQIKLFAQGVSHSNRHRLIQEFKEQTQAVLFGTNSLWEGVDIPGDKLSTLVIVRLPFWPPNHPVIEARTENLKRHGRNAFTEYSVPQAIVRFKQGFGRLVRSTKDVGAVVVLDRRIVDASYGKTFLHSLPGPRMFQGTRREIYAAIYHWLQTPIE